MTGHVVGPVGLEPTTNGSKGCGTPTTPVAACGSASDQLAGPHCDCLCGRQFASHPCHDSEPVANPCSRLVTAMSLTYGAPERPTTASTGHPAQDRNALDDDRAGQLT